MLSTIETRVSVLIPTYNRATLLGRALRSVFAQTFREFEIHVIDDGSTDDSPAVVASFADARLHYHPLPHCGQLTRLRNHSIQLARGEFVAFLDSDDEWAAEKLSRQVEYLDGHPDRVFCCAEVERIRADGHSRGGIYRKLVGRDGVYEVSPSQMLKSLLASQILIYPTTAMVRRAALLDIGGFDERLRSGDSECFFRLAHAYPGALLLQPLAKIHTHDDNVSRRWQVDGYDEMLQALDHFSAIQAIEAEEAATLRTRYSALRERVVADGFEPWVPEQSAP